MLIRLASELQGLASFFPTCSGAVELSHCMGMLPWCWDPNPGPYTCAAGIFPVKPSPQPPGSSCWKGFSLSSGRGSNQSALNREEGCAGDWESGNLAASKVAFECY